MTVDVEVWAWTPQGMRRTVIESDGYVSVREVERLLEEAHARGIRAGQASAQEFTL